MEKKSKIIILVLFSSLILTILSIYKQSKNTENIIKKGSRELSSLVQDVQEKIQLINNETNYETRTLNNEQFLDQMTDGGGELIGYFKNGQINKIIERVGLSYGVKTFEYYFWNWKLIAVYEKEENFPEVDNTGVLDHAKLELVFEGQYFFKEEKLFQTKTKGQKKFSEDTKIDIEQTLLTMAKRDIELLSR